MAENTNDNTAALAFILGGVVVVLGILVYVFYGGDMPNEGPEINIEVPDPSGN